MAKLVSKVYGDALLDLARQENCVEEFYPQVQELVRVLQENQELVTLLEQPKVVKEEKIKVMEEIFSGRVAKEIVGLMVLLIEKSHYTDIEDVFSYFIDEVKELKGIGIAYVTTAVELRSEQRDKVEARLLETTKYQQFEMHYAVEASLIGGMVIRIGDRVMDSSIKTRIYDLSKELKNIQLL